MADTAPFPDETRRASSGSVDAALREQLLERRRRLAGLPHLARREDVRTLIREVDAALDRFRGGTYGLCEGCHESIETDRLLADPLVRVCLGCLSEDQVRALERDLELAASIQGGLLPAEAVRLDGWSLRYRYLPHGVVGGDHCDVVPPARAAGPAHFTLGDVSGKGVAASLLMSHLHAIFRTLAAQEPALDTMMARANRLFAESTLPSSYATLVAGRLAADGTLEVCNAGHCPPLLVRRGEVVPLPATGIPLGLVAEARFEVRRTGLEPGDWLFLYTDGVSEARNGDGEAYGEARLRDAVGGLDGSAPDRVVETFLAGLGRFQGGAPRQDDLTVMTVHRSG